MGKQLPQGPECPACGKSVDPTGYIEVLARRIMGPSVVMLGSAMFHIDCYMDDEDGPLDVEEKEIQKGLRRDANEGDAPEERHGDAGTRPKAPA